MFFVMTHRGGGIVGVEREGDWPETMKIDPYFLEVADERWVSHGDGLVTFRTDSEIATYGLVGEAADPLPVGRILLARLLSVGPNESL